MSAPTATATSYRALHFPVDSPPKEVTIEYGPKELEQLQQFVGGFIQEWPFTNIEMLPYILYVDKEAKIKTPRPAVNKLLTEWLGKEVFGPALFVQIGGDDQDHTTLTLTLDEVKRVMCPRQAFVTPQRVIEPRMAPNAPPRARTAPNAHSSTATHPPRAALNFDRFETDA